MTRHLSIIMTGELAIIITIIMTKQLIIFVTGELVIIMTIIMVNEMLNDRKKNTK